MRLPTGVAILLALFVLAPAHAHAVACAIEGDLQIEPLTSYYCDTNSLGCGGWLETDLDTATKPLPHMVILIIDPASGFVLGGGESDANGHYVIPFEKWGSCSGKVWFTVTFSRLHEDDNYYFGPRYRFWLVDDNNLGYNQYIEVPLAGPTTFFSKLYAGLDTPFIDPYTKYANVYYTIDSAIKEMKGWSSRIDDALMSFWVRYVVGENPGNAAVPGVFGGIILNEAEYNLGLGTRHELGHRAHTAIHRGNMTGWGFSYLFSNDGFPRTTFVENPGHGDMTCEWGDANMVESLATFFGVRSITTANSDVWACGSNDNTTQDACSLQAANLPTSDSDRALNFNTGRIWGIGDRYATTRDHCPRLRIGSACGTCSGLSCTDCPDIGAEGICDNYEALGFRAEINTVRFLWDLIDASDEGGEGTNETITSFVALLESMPCPSLGSWGADGSCRESRRSTPSQVVPLDPVGPPVTPMRSTRDAYNPWDFGDLVPGNQSTARSINCVDAATD